MVKVLAMLLLLFMGSLALTLSSPPVDDGEDLQALQEKILAELAARALRAAKMSPFGFRGGFPSGYGFVKRNSELINSLLGLPKVVTQAGKRK